MTPIYSDKLGIKFRGQIACLREGYCLRPLITKIVSEGLYIIVEIAAPYAG